VRCTARIFPAIRNDQNQSGEQPITTPRFVLANTQLRYASKGNGTAFQFRTSRTIPRGHSCARC
jgi:hypothetical protein